MSELLGQVGVDRILGIGRDTREKRATRTQLEPEIRAQLAVPVGGQAGQPRRQAAAVTQRLLARSGHGDARVRRQLVTGGQGIGTLLDLRIARQIALVQPIAEAPRDAAADLPAQGAAHALQREAQQLVVQLARPRRQETGIRWGIRRQAEVLEKAAHHLVALDRVVLDRLELQEVQVVVGAHAAGRTVADRHRPRVGQLQHRARHPVLHAEAVAVAIAVVMPVAADASPRRRRPLGGEPTRGAVLARLGKIVIALATDVSAQHPVHVRPITQPQHGRGQPVGSRTGRGGLLGTDERPPFQGPATEAAEAQRTTGAPAVAQAGAAHLGASEVAAQVESGEAAEVGTPERRNIQRPDLTAVGIGKCRNTALRTQGGCGLEAKRRCRLLADAGAQVDDKAAFDQFGLAAGLQRVLHPRRLVGFQIGNAAQRVVQTAAQRA
mmetsp:Transcript_39181/g.91998  ORF Transcript_39181/g.91998 Transcript_39181/m.91998 type:complete len:438 (-) Transcript_39181:1274-2587(-)